MTSYGIVADPGKTVSPDLVAEVAGILGDQPGVAAVRLADHVAVARSDRELIDEVLG